jgi:hypothetical protein
MHYYRSSHFIDICGGRSFIFIEHGLLKHSQHHSLSNWLRAVICPATLQPFHSQAQTASYYLMVGMTFSGKVVRTRNLYFTLPYLHIFHHLPQKIALYQIVRLMFHQKLHYFIVICRRISPEVNINNKTIVQLHNKVLPQNMEKSTLLY